MEDLLSQFTRIVNLEKRLDPALQFVLEAWMELIRNHAEIVENFALDDLKVQMVDLAVDFYDNIRTNAKNCSVEWNEFYIRDYYSVLIRSENSLSFLFPFDLIRFSTFNSFIKKMIQELELNQLFSKENVSLSFFIDKIPVIANECKPHLTKSDIQLMEAAVSISLSGEGREDLRLLRDVIETTRWKKQIKQKLTTLGVFNTGTRINYSVLGLMPYLVYHEQHLPISWTDFIYMEIFCERNMKATLVYIPEKKKNKILSQLKNLGRVSPLEKGGSCYNLSLFNMETESWEIDIKGIFVSSRGEQPKKLDFTAFEEATPLTPVTDQLIEILSHVSKLEFMKARELADITGIAYSKITYWFRKIVTASLVKAQVVLKFIGLPYIYHLLLEKDGNQDLIAALHELPKVSVYQFKDLYLFLLYLPKETIFDLERFLSEYQKSGTFKIQSKGTLALGDTLKYKNLDFSRIWDRKRKTWNFS
ncbi:MAG: hypothetical protein ACFFD4_04130 [Candidatus Odinarchaeota archaeon]